MTAEPSSTETGYILNWDDKILAVPIVKKTKCYAWYPAEWFGRIKDERISLEKVFPTWEACHARLLEKARLRLKHAEQSVDQCRSYLQKIEGMKP